MSQPARVRAQIDEIETHVDGLKSFWLATERRVPRFRPGQFLHLAIDRYNPASHWPESRPFSIASPPEERTRLRLTVSAVGAFTRRMMNLEVGDEVWVKLPYGEFIVAKDAERATVLVAGGTGMTPFASLLSSAPPAARPIRLLYGARRPELLVYANIVQQAARRLPDFAAQLVVEEGERAGLMRGRLSVSAALRLARDAGPVDTTAFYLAGPPGMVDVFTAGLANAGISPACILVDRWS
jgi:ferredoxin-NADP reductase